MHYTEYDRCMLCPRECGAARGEGRRGRCGIADRMIIARAALHFWEEPCISGKEGSGAVFFSGCSLGCVFCQNREISRGRTGEAVTEDELAEIFLELQAQKANNINLVTAGHVVPQIRQALIRAKERGLTIPIVYNSSGYEKTETLGMLEGMVDIYLPDLKYLSSETAGNWSGAPDYPETAKAAIGEMVRQVRTAARDAPLCRFDDRGMMTGGVIVRHLLMPGKVRQGKEVTTYLYETYKDEIYMSLMSQYTPMPDVKEDPLLARTVTKREYERFLNHVLELGAENVFIQEGGVAKESFIPAFDGTGVKNVARQA